MRKTTLKRSKLGALAAMMVCGGTMLSACTMADVKLNLVAGSLAALKTAATNWVATFLPVPPKK